MSGIQGTEIDYKLETPEEGAALGGQGGKRGHKCCGGCCDVRRAVIILNLVTLGMMLFALFGLLAAMSRGAQSIQYLQDYDDDEVKAIVEEWDNLSFGAIIAVAVVRILCCLCGVAGAIYYNIWLVGVAGLMYVATVIWAIISLQFLDIIYPAFFAYPHYFLIKEIREGIMTEENYPNEKQSCCCV